MASIDNKVTEKPKNGRLEEIISDFYKLTNNESAPAFNYNTLNYLNNKSEADEYYEYLNKNLNANYSLSDIEEFAGSAELDKLLDDEEKLSKLGLFISAAVNKVIKNGEKVSINPKIPINYLCYKLKDTEAYIGIGGNLIGCYTENSKIYIDNVLVTGKNIAAKAPSEVFYSVFDGYVMSSNAMVLYHLGLGYDRKNSKIYIRDIYYQHPVTEPGYKSAEYIAVIDYDMKKKNENQVFLSKNFYNQHPLRLRMNGIKKWKDGGSKIIS